MKNFVVAACIASIFVLGSSPVFGQDSAPSGTASGEVVRKAHTERIGPMLGGSIKVIEGRTPADAGQAAFNAFAVISWDQAGQRFMMRSYANGQAGDFPLTADETGFSWVIPAGPGEMRFHTTIVGNEWVETGDFVMTGRPATRSVELRLRRRGDTTWRAGDPVQP
ncbi:hypothetical protein BH10PSE1_BH10PSE1_23380 [soil metagenome]